jgi:hypothetical protein
MIRLLAMREVEARDIEASLDHLAQRFFVI